MKTGIELIAQERAEQIEKHGWTKVHDAKINSKKELVQVATYCLMLAKYKHYTNLSVVWPDNWGAKWKDKINAKPPLQKLIVAGALLTAENERRHDNFWRQEILGIANGIDRLQATA
jgi:hypothetical protein